ncbi:Membrane protein involved in the export of O-antigen and teichoic acid [Salipiger thiooxidans]|uniref:Membrane protein involved in the export of O-antigen and teichoic acid n=1 Tax=Salipiger thiooxidans TaxID=282683 RepID=A0A1G7CGG6_9RHOB|nr:oligosaccharide flippase family protein [Salipiger thiooxidans]SDE37776.1 Membrane protein involved in the export of O-antigen and teichoic acid [Salipiger thiooxidans]
MTVALLHRFNGSSLTARVMRSSLLTVGGFGVSQALRLGSNLILTRLLFPEAFGLMALVSVFMMGLQQFSDVGVAPAILQSRRGDERDFLNTAWTIQALRGAGLFLLGCALAWPMALFYDEPQLLHILPVASLALLITGFRPTRMDTANRHLLVGRLTLLDFVTQTTGVVSAVILAWVTGSVWALVLSGLIAAVTEVAINSLFLPGERNRFRWEPAAASELVTFGKWIFLSTVCGFFFSQGDKILMGKYLSLDLLGIYNIGYFLAAFPMLLGSMVTRRILIPIYRETPPRESRANFLRLRKMRFLVTLVLMVLVGGFAIVGDGLVDLLYDPRYALAGAVVVIVACAQMPQIIVQTYDQAALAAGDSRTFFVLALARAVLMVGCIIAGLEIAGLLGALLGLAAAYVLAYPVVVWLARRMGAWDPLHDAVYALAAAVLSGIAVAVNWSEIMALVAS